MGILMDVYRASHSEAEIAARASLAPVNSALATPNVIHQPAPISEASPLAAAPSAAPAAASTPEAWRAEWNASAGLQAEFQNVEGYVALRKAEAAGRVKIISKVPVQTSSAGTLEGWRAEWSASAALQAEFADAGDYIALRKAEKAGRVKLWR